MLPQHYGFGRLQSKATALPSFYSGTNSAEARTRLEASHAANSSLKECSLRPVPQLATGQRRAVSSARKRYGTVSYIGS
jgi:hypothetical protein